MHLGGEVSEDVRRVHLSGAFVEQITDGFLRQLRRLVGDLVSVAPADHCVVAVDLEGLGVCFRRHQKRRLVEVVVNGVAGQLHHPVAEERQPPLVRGFLGAPVGPHT